MPESEDVISYKHDDAFNSSVGTDFQGSNDSGSSALQRNDPKAAEGTGEEEHNGACQVAERSSSSTYFSTIYNLPCVHPNIPR